jgi:hypothetical protein
MKILPYNRNDAVEYAKRWAFHRNPAYYDFDKLGGDCTNFASQCLFAGAKIMNYSKNEGWFYVNLNNRSYSWTSVPLFYNFMINNKSVGPIGKKCNIEDLEIGDFIQLGDLNRYYHTLLIVRIEGVPSIDTIYISSHTYDSFNRPLSSYFFEKYRCIHIDRVQSW